MAYDNPTVWKNDPNTTSPINADNLNKIEKGIKDASYDADFANDNLLNLQKEISSGDKTIELKTVWEQGNLASGAETDAANRIRISDFIYLGGYEKIVVSASGVQTAAVYYNANFEYVTETGMSGSEYTIIPSSSNIYVRFKAKYSNNSSILPSAGGNVTLTAYSIANNKSSDLNDFANVGIVNANIANGMGKVNLYNPLEQGHLVEGVESDSYLRVRSKTFIFVGQFREIEAKSTNYQFGIQTFDVDKNYISSTSVDGAAKSLVPSGSVAYIRIVVKKSDNTQITPSDVGNDIVITAYSNKEILKRYLNTKYMQGNKPFDVIPGYTLDANGNPATQGLRGLSDFRYANAGDRITVQFTDQYQVAVALFDSDFNFVSTNAYIKYYEFTSNTYFRLILKRADNAAITSEMVTEFEEQSWYREKPLNLYNTGERDILSINHMGWWQVPRESEQAYIESYKHGFPFVEGDVRFTKDSVGVLCHNDTINEAARMPDGSEIPETVYIADCTYEELLEYDFGIAIGPEFAGTKILSLEEWIVLCKQLGLKMYLDCKELEDKTKTLSIVSLLKDYGMFKNATFISSNVRGLQWIVANDETARVGYNGNAANWFNPWVLITGKNAVFMNADSSTITSARVTDLKTHKIPLEAWVVEEDTIENVDGYVTGYTSDRLVAELYFKGKYE